MDKDAIRKRCLVRIYHDEFFRTDNPTPMARLIFPPSRTEALERLALFIPAAGRSYERERNTDAGQDHPNGVSRLSPYVRHRIITEHEIISEVLACHSLPVAEKFVQEVLWRTYWKGWLEMRPAAWSRFLEERNRQRDSFHDQSAIADAEAGRTGIEGFDDWAKELVDTGYLHNHARMWFASIWIFTLRLPWVLGADFFLRHLLDADAASNTLSWRWVAGLQTIGKTYLATTDNIARYTNGRFAPKGLALDATALTEPAIGSAQDLEPLPLHDPLQASLLLVTHEDMHPESAFRSEYNISSVLVATDADLLWGDGARQFVSSAAHDLTLRTSVQFKCPTNRVNRLDAKTLITSARDAGVRQIITPYAPVGPVADALADITPVVAEEGITFVSVRRDWDSRFWPHAKKGFFAFKEKMPVLLRESGLL